MSWKKKPSMYERQRDYKPRAIEYMGYRIAYRPRTRDGRGPFYQVRRILRGWMEKDYPLMYECRTRHEAAIWAADHPLANPVE